MPYIIKGPVTLTSKIAFELAFGAMGWFVGHELALALWEKSPRLPIRNEENVPEPPVAIHWTNERCQKYLGMPGAYEAGFERLNWFTQLINNWMGDHGEAPQAGLPVPRLPLAGRRLPPLRRGDRQAGGGASTWSICDLDPEPSARPAHHRWRDDGAAAVEGGEVRTWGARGSPRRRVRHERLGALLRPPLRRPRRRGDQGGGPGGDPSRALGPFRAESAGSRGERTLPLPERRQARRRRRPRRSGAARVLPRAARRRRRAGREQRARRVRALRARADRCASATRTWWWSRSRPTAAAGPGRTGRAPTSRPRRRARCRSPSACPSASPCASPSTRPTTRPRSTPSRRRCARCTRARRSSGRGQGVDVSVAQVMAYCVGGMHLVGAKGGAKWGQRSTGR